METANAIFQTVLDYAQTGYEQVNAVLGLIIALVAALIMPSYGRIVVMTIGAVLAHQVVVTLMPVIQGGEFKLPEVFQQSFWEQILFLLIGYFIVITIFYMLRRVLLKR